MFYYNRFIYYIYGMYGLWFKCSRVPTDSRHADCHPNATIPLLDYQLIYYILYTFWFAILCKIKLLGKYMFYMLVLRIFLCL